MDFLSFFFIFAFVEPYHREANMKGVPCGGCAYVEGVLMWRVCSCGGCAHVEGVLMWRVCLCGGCAHVEGVLMWSKRQFGGRVYQFEG